MNKTNVQHAINIMKRAAQHEESFDMSRWQRAEYDSDLVETEKNFHSCGNTACFAGWVAISPEFHADCGVVGFGGVPLIDGLGGEEAIASWLGVSDKLATNLCIKTVSFERPFYPVPFEDVKPHHVIEKLELILAGKLK